MIFAVLFSTVPGGRAQESAQDISTNRALPPLPVGVKPPSPPEALRQIPTRTLRLEPPPPGWLLDPATPLPPAIPMKSPALAQTTSSNLPDAWELAVSNSILRCEKMLANTNLSPWLRTTLQKQMEEQKRRLPLLQERAALLRDLRNAQRTGDQTKIAEAQQRLTDFPFKPVDVQDGKVHPRPVGIREIPPRTLKLNPGLTSPDGTNYPLTVAVPPPPPEGLRQIPTRTLKLTPSTPPNPDDFLLPQGMTPTNPLPLGTPTKQRPPTNYVGWVELMYEDKQLNPAIAASNSVRRSEKRLANPNLPPSLRKSYEKEIEVNQRRLRDAQADEVLWNDVRNARAAGDQKKLADAEQKLANYLVKKFEAWDLKTYPRNLTLKEVAELYRKRISTGR